MAFKKVTDYNESRFGGFFLLRNDGDYADVIFLYRNRDDELVGDTHYIKSSSYSGYVQCIGTNCPACRKGIRVQTKLFIPLYNLEAGEIQFWDRSMRFEPQLEQQVFKNFFNPSEYVFRITRHGAAGDVNTTYDIQAVARNTSKSYAQILAENNSISPEYYNKVCKDYSAAELQSLLNEDEKSDSSSYTPYSATSLPEYQVKPRSISSMPNASDVETSLLESDIDVEPLAADVNDASYSELDDEDDVVF